MASPEQKGYFITFEGGEGVGKTTQIKQLQNFLSQSYDVILTREPGGTLHAEEIRNLLSHDELGEQWTPEAETMLLFAARAMHIKDVIAPSIEQGKVVISDRYIDSTRVYQGYIQKLDMGFILGLEKRVVGSYIPDLTIILDLGAEKAMERVQSRGGALDHYDRGDLTFYQNLRQGFLDIAEKNANRCVVINADQSEDAIAAEIQTIVGERLSHV